MALTRNRLAESLTYDPLTGVFVWRERRGNKHPGDLAGCMKRTYVVINIDGVCYRAHHLAWFYMTGELPTLFIDHRDTNKHNNAWSNLRLATKSQNMANVGLIKSNASGFKGVSRYRAGEAYGKPWQASICLDKRTRHLGHFATREEAHAAYCEAAGKLFGEFARAA